MGVSEAVPTPSGAVASELQKSVNLLRCSSFGSLSLTCLTFKKKTKTKEEEEEE